MNADLKLIRRSTALALFMGLTIALLPAGTAQALVTVPGAPSGLSPTPGNGQVALSWTAPSDAGGAAITDYVIEQSSDAGSTWSTFADGTSASTSATVTGLTNGTAYTFRVKATNSAGTGAVSTTAAATPTTVPGAPTGLSATAGDGQVSLSWTAPSEDGGTAITDYVIEVSSAGSWSAFTDGTSAATSATVTGLTNGTAYTFRVKATNSAGTGAVSATAAATSAATVPGTPSELSAIPGRGQVALSWTAPSDAGGAAITDYVIEQSDDAGSTWSTFADGTSAATSATVTGLTNGTAYTFRVKATNSAGTGAVSATATATPVATVPGAPSELSTTPSNGQVALSWTAPSEDGGTAITDYVIEQSDDAGSSWPTLSSRTSTATSATVTGLTNGTAYTFRVKATNSAGTGPVSDTAAATPAATVPGAPSELSATLGQGQVALSWTAPSDAGGAAITDYEIEVSSGGSWSAFADEASAATSATVTGLTNGTAYTFRVKATNSAGTGPVSDTVAATPAAIVPGAPSELSAISGNDQVALSWTAPDDGGAAITDYVIEVSSGGSWSTFVDRTSASTSATVTELTNGTEYTFRVKATNRAGTSPVSDTASATPGAVPGAPSGLTATPGNGQVTLSWTAPSEDGGAAITDYEVEQSDDAGSTWSTSSFGTSASTSETVTRLTDGTAYTFRVAAINSAGAGPVSDTTTAIPGAATALANSAPDLTIEVTLELDAEVKPEDSEVVVTVTNVPPTATVTIATQSEPVILGVVSPDEDGNVTFRAPLPPLPDGQHNLVVTVQTDNGTLKTTSIPFFVNDEFLVSQSATTDGFSPGMALYAWLLIFVGAVAVVLVARRSGIFMRH